VTADAASSNVVVHFRVAGRGLDKKDWFGKSDPYLEIHRGGANGSSSTSCLVFRSEVIKNTLEPTWAEFELNLATLCNGDRRRQLKFTVWDWNASGRPDLIGSFTTSLDQLEGDNRTYQVGEM
jgi:Ca2+-dependent lipid-binding protein